MAAIKDKPTLSPEQCIEQNVEFLSKEIIKHRGSERTLARGSTSGIFIEHQIIGIDKETGLIGPADSSRFARGFYKSPSDDIALIDYEFITPGDASPAKDLLPKGYTAVPCKLHLSEDISPAAMNVLQQTKIKLFGPVFPVLRAAIEKFKDNRKLIERLVELINTLEGQLPE